jgi:uncharacterized protein (TIGR02145 family)
MNCKIKMPRISVLFLISLLFLIASCKKSAIPSVTTVTVNLIQQTNAYSGGQITSDGGEHVSRLGVCWSTAEDPDINDNKTEDTLGLGGFISHITGLTPKTMYYVKAYASNSEGTGYGNQVSFTTDDVALPTLTTTSLKSLSMTSAASGGYITNDGGIPVTARGVCWNTTGSPTIVDSFTSNGEGKGVFTSILTGLTLNEIYHVRAYATNSLGTSYGDEVEFTQVEPVLDQDGNAYRVVTIGTQTWFGENLKTTTFNDGTAIPNITNGAEWSIISTPAHCWYNDNEATFKEPYGALYNFHAVNTGKLCPAGWHVPVADEYTAMMVYLGGLNIAGGKLKESGTSHWASPNLDATNESGFTALPGGARFNTTSQGGVFSDLGFFGYFWTSTSVENSITAYSFDMGFNQKSVIKSVYSKTDGGSVRCIKDSN